MTTPRRAHRTRAPVRAAIIGTAALLLAACSTSAEPEPPTLDEALDAADALLSGYEGLEDVLVEPRPGRGSADLTLMATQSARSIRIQCISPGEMVVRIDGEERFAETCDDTSVDLGAYGVDLDGAIIGTLSESTIEIEAADDVYWVAALFTHANGRFD